MSIGTRMNSPMTDLADELDLHDEIYRDNIPSKSTEKFSADSMEELERLIEKEYGL